MKKFIAVLLILSIFTVIAAGCGKKEPAPVTSSVAETSPSTAVEQAPAKPTKAEAAAHNAAIRPEDVNLIQFDDPDAGDKLAVIATNGGDIKIRLFEKQAPNTVATFIKLVNEGYYNGQQFDTIVAGYKIEGGGKHDDSQYPDEKEFSLDLWNFRGAVALANVGTDFMIIDATQTLNPKSELEELNFPEIVIEKYEEVGGAPHQDWENTVFGQVIEGMDVVEKFASATLNEDGTPKEPIVITTIKIETV